MRTKTSTTTHTSPNFFLHRRLLYPYSICAYHEVLFDIRLCLFSCRRSVSQWNQGMFHWFLSFDLRSDGHRVIVDSRGQVVPLFSWFKILYGIASFLANLYLIQLYSFFWWFLYSFHHRFATMLFTMTMRRPCPIPTCKRHTCRTTFTGETWTVWATWRIPWINTFLSTVEVAGHTEPWVVWRM